MNPRLLPLALLAACLAAPAFAAEETAAPAPEKTDIKDILKARLAAEEAKTKSAKPAPAPAANPLSTKPAPVAGAKPSGPTPAGATAAPIAPPGPPVTQDVSPEAAKAKEEKATMLPQVEVKRDPIAVIEQQNKIYEQEKQILIEKRKTKPTEMDKALNDPKVAKAMSIFGGESSDYRANLAKERVSLMEEEKDLMEAITHAKTKEEKAELQKQIDEIKSLRRDLEKSMR